MAKLCIKVASAFLLRTIPPEKSARPGMVIINTKAVEVSIQAVSPELILSVPMSCGSVGAAAASAAAGSAAAGAAGCAVAAHAAGMENVNRPSTTNRDNLVINAIPF